MLTIGWRSTLVEAVDGTVLAHGVADRDGPTPGQIVYQDRQRTFVVAAADEDVLVIEPRDLAEAARVAHLIGNLHRDIEVTPTEIVALADRTLGRAAAPGPVSPPDRQDARSTAARRANMRTDSATWRCCGCCSSSTHSFRSAPLRIREAWRPTAQEGAQPRGAQRS